MLSPQNFYCYCLIFFLFFGSPFGIIQGIDFSESASKVCRGGSTSDTGMQCIGILTGNLLELYLVLELNPIFTSYKSPKTFGAHE